MLGSWWDAVPTLLAAAALLLVPGVLVVRAAGLRGVLAAGAAPAVSASVLSVAAVLAGGVGLAWGWPTVAVSIGVAVALALLVRRLPASTREPLDPPPTLGTALGVAAGAVLVLATLGRGIGRPGALSQTYDAVFHLNAVRWVLDHQDGSSLHLAAAGRGSGQPGFYPGAWHDLVALVAKRPGTSTVVDVVGAANLTAMTVAALAWPLGCAALAHVTLGRRWRLAAAVAGVLSAGFTAAPYLLLSFGVLWPNAMAVSLLPGLLALLVRSVEGRGWREGLVLLGALPGLALVHPGGLFAFGVLALPMVALAAAPGVRTAWVRRPRRTAVVLLGVLAAAALAATIVASSPLVRAVSQHDWRARESVAQAAGEVLLNAQLGGPAAWVLSATVVVGAVVAWREPRTRWIVVSHVAGALLFVLAAGSDSRLSQALTGLWYNDSFRLAALAPVTGVALAAAGVLSAADALTRRLPQVTGVARPAAAVLPVAVVLTIVVVGSGGLSWRDHTTRIRLSYSGTAYLGPGERALLQRLANEVPPGAVVAGSPWNGTALSYALADRRSLFPHLVSGWDTDRELVAGHLDQVAQDPRVCPALDRLGVRWVVGGESSFWTRDRRQAKYAGMVDLAGRAGLRAVDRGGRLTLYEVTACGAIDPRGAQL
ncbi:hypothetical protein GCM10023145_39220 [Angustibacter luteus]